MAQTYEKAYLVYTQGDVEGKGPSSLLGVATGNESDIKDFYDDRKMYSITLSPVNIQNVTPDTISERKRLIQERKDLELRLKELDKKL